VQENDPPILVSDNFTFVQENTPLWIPVYQYLAFDEDNDTVTFSIIGTTARTLPVWQVMSVAITVFAMLIGGNNNTAVGRSAFRVGPVNGSLVCTSNLNYEPGKVLCSCKRFVGHALLEAKSFHRVRASELPTLRWIH
jgi:hypothetical protein